MKISLYLFSFFTSVFGFSQALDSVTIKYHIGYDCTNTIQSKELRGGCMNSETIEYQTKRKGYVAKKRIRKEIFREWDRGFGPNILEDSMKTHLLWKDKKLPSKKFDTLIQQICVIKSNTIFPYEVKDIPKSFLLKNDLDPKNLKVALVDSILKNKFKSFIFSTVTGYFTISFQVKGKKYTIWKNTNNPYWSFQPEESDSENPVYFFCFTLDAFLCDHLPRNFSGFKLLN